MDRPEPGFARLLPQESPRLRFAVTLLIFAAAAWSWPPDVNEPHYLAKARHAWDPDWAQGDMFLESRAAHGLFFLAFGWLTTLVPFPIAAWLGRLACWSLLAWGWSRLTRAFGFGDIACWLAAGLFAAFLSWGHMAGEWVLGGVESKGFAYAFVLFGLEALVLGRWPRVWLLLGTAAAFHVLVGGWSVVAALVAWRLSRAQSPPLSQMVASLSGGFLLSLAGLAPAIAMNWGTPPEVVAEANRIYVFERLPHHLLLGSVPRWFLLRHLVLIVVFGWLVIRTEWSEAQYRLIRFVGGAMLVALAGLFVDIAFQADPRVIASLLRFYWYRLSDVAVPLGVSFAAVATCYSAEDRTRRGFRPAFALLILIAVGHIVDHQYQQLVDPRPPAIAQGMNSQEAARVRQARFDDWKRVCDWIANNTEPEAVILSPRHQQTMKWYAQRGEVANWKDVPQDAEGIVRWWERMQRLYPPETAWRGLANHGEETLLTFARAYGFTYILLDRSRSQRALSFERLYPPNGVGRFFELYRVPPVAGSSDFRSYRVVR